MLEKMNLLGAIVAIVYFVLIILGCTELPLLITEGQGRIPLFDTTTIHARAAVEYALGAHS